MDVKRLILYVLWGILALLIWNAWQHDYPPKQVATPTEQHQQQSAVSSNTQASQTTSSKITNNVPVNQQIQIHTDVLNVAIDEQSGKLIQANLPLYPKSVDEKHQPFVLLNDNKKTYYTAGSGITGFNDVKYTTDQTHYTLQPKQKVLNVVFHAEKNNVAITKTYTFKRNSYVIHVNYKITNHAHKQWSGRYFMQTTRYGETGKGHHLLGLRSFFGVATSSKQEPFDKVAFSKLSEDPINQTIKGGWMAFVQHYFLSAWVPQKEAAYLYESQDLGNNLYRVTLMGSPLSAAYGQSVVVSSKFYVGPAIKSRLDKVAPHLWLTIDYGWLWMISILLFAVMNFIHMIVGNWGVSIILLTILIKLVFYKLSEKSYRSMAAMRDLQPKIKALKEEYKDDRQALGKATMELYRKEKANPMSGCLPMIVQIPVFIGLYYLLAESVQLRMAHFLWIQDLSLKDPYYILPILMGVSMFVQQRLSPPPADPTQAKVMMFLPVFFTFIFLNFPAGLTLYWLTNNTVSVLQQWYIMRKHKRGHYKKKVKRKKKK